MLIRKALEAEAVRVVTGNHMPELIDTLQRNMSYQRAAVEIDDQNGFHERDLEFHDIIFGDMRFTKVKGVIENTRANLDRARRLILTPRRLSVTIAEHQAHPRRHRGRRRRAAPRRHARPYRLGDGRAHRLCARAPRPVRRWRRWHDSDSFPFG